MADAGPHSEAVDLSQRAPQADPRRWNPLRSRSSLEGRDFLSCNLGGGGCLRLGFRTIWPQRAARPDDCADRSQAGLLFSLDLRSPGLSSAIDGDALHSDCPDFGYWNSAGAAILRSGRREELAS